VTSTESAETDENVASRADRLLHVVCCTKPELALCEAPITEVLQGTADCVVCADLEPAVQEGWCLAARQLCPLEET
jgi:hypothetical protein